MHFYTVNLWDYIPVLQIKGTFNRTYTDAVLNYNAEDEVSRAVDNLQHKVSPHDTKSSHS